MTPRRSRTAALALGLAVALAACGGGSGEGGSPPGTDQDPPGTTTTTARPGPLADQTPPKSAFGITWDRDKLWIADYDGGEVIAVDPATGEILVRWTGSDGVTKGVVDVVVGPDESLYWTGFDDGSVDRMYQGNFVPIAGLEPGLNGIGLTEAGEVYVTRADEGTKEGGDGLWEIDPKGQRQPRLVAEELGMVNSFSIGSDGFIYGPRAGDGRPGSGELVKVDPTSGAVTVLARGFDAPVAAKLSPDGKRAFVLSSTPPAVAVVDLAAGTVEPWAEPGTMFVNGLAVAPDGTLYVTALDEPTITVIRPDRTISTLTIGRPDADR